MQDRVYIAIDLKSFYASVECVELGLDPLSTNLVVADLERTSKTVCLAVSPSLKQYGIGGRARLYEVEEKVKEINYLRRKKIKYKSFTGKSTNDKELKNNLNLELDYIVAKPRMAYYMKYSNNIYKIYLKYVSHSDMHIYSVDEVFIDATSYLKLYKLSAYEFAMKIINDILKETGITATCGIAPNLYLCKVAMDIVAKHINGNKDGVRIAELDVSSYRKLLWNHKPLTDFWRVGKGIEKKLIDNKIYTMGDLARASLNSEEKLFKLFGINAELLIDHAWGYESCTISDIKKYRPKVNSISTSQVLHTPYNSISAKVVTLEMTDSLILDIVSKRLVTNRIDLIINYDTENINEFYKGEIKKDYYGRNIPKDSHGFINLEKYTSSTKIILHEMGKIYDRIVKTNLSIRKITIAFSNIIDKSHVKNIKNIKQLDLFSNNEEEISEDKDEESIQNTIINIRKKYGKNAILKGMNFKEGATARDRNKQIGGHHE